MEEDYIVQEDNAGSSGGSNRPFLTAVGLLLFVFILAAGCGAFNLLSRGGGTDQTTVASATIEAIETQNAIVQVTNEAVTLTIMAMETEAARPTETPTLPPTATQAPPATETPPPPTETPVVPEGEVVEGETGEGEGDAAGETGEAGETGTGVTGPTDDSTPTPIPVVTGNDKGALPDTGIDTWSAMLLGLALVAVLLMARRLRRA